MTNADRASAIEEYLRTHEAKKEWQPIRKKIWGVKGFPREQFLRIIKRNKAEAVGRLREYKERTLRREQPNV